MQAAQMLIAKSQRAGFGELLLDLQRSLLGGRVLHMGVHRAEGQTQVGRQRGDGITSGNVGEDWSACLGWDQ